MMRTLLIQECKKCAEKILLENIAATNAGEPIDIIWKSVAKCETCRRAESRTAGGRNKRMTEETKFHP